MKHQVTAVAVLALALAGCDHADNIGNGLVEIAHAPGMMWDGVKEDIEGKISRDDNTPSNTVVVQPTPVTTMVVSSADTTSYARPIEPTGSESPVYTPARVAVEDPVVTVVVVPTRDVEAERQAAAREAREQAERQEAARAEAEAEADRLAAQREAEREVREQAEREEAARAEAERQEYLRQQQLEADRLVAEQEAERAANDDEFITEGEENPYPTFVDYNSNERPGGRSWADSYLFEGRCYIDSTFDHDADVEVDTPYGRMRVSQVQDLIGRGPGFDHAEAMYNDVQCGWGPANDAGDEDIGRCPGRVDQGASGCGTRGPRWTFPAQ